MVLTALSLVVILAALFYLYSTWTFTYWKKKGVPYVKPMPLFGNIFDALVSKAVLPDVLMKIYEAGSGLPLVGFYKLRTPALLVRDPEIVKKILVTDFDSFNEFYSVDSTLDPLLSRNPFSLSGDKWKAVRALLSPAFTSAKMKSLFPLMAVECREMIHYLKKEAPKNRPGGLPIKDLLTKFTTDVVVRCGFGVYGNSFSDSEPVLQELGQNLLGAGAFRNFKFLLYTLFPKIRNVLKLRFLSINEQLFFMQLIKELITYRESNRIFRNDYLQMLIHVKSTKKSLKGESTIRVAGIDMEYSEEDIASHALTLFCGGFAFASHILSFALYRLSLNQNYQNKLRDEIDEVLQDHGGRLTYEIVEDMSYLDMIISETLRMHPLFPSVPRLCTKAYQLPLPDGSSFILEEGTAVSIPVEALQMDPQHFPEPHVFDPERFSDKRKASIKPFTYLPYGAGPRRCLGMKFAQAQMKIGLVAIVFHFIIRPTSKTPKSLEKVPYGWLFDVKGGLWLDFVRRF